MNHISFRISIVFLFLGCLFLISCNNPKTPGKNTIASNEKESKTVPIIFDTDIQGDYDDVGALAMLHALADSGEVKILATVGSNRSPLVVPTIEIINRYFGRPNIPIGVLKNGGVKQDTRELHWSDSLVAHYPHKFKSNSDAPDAVTVYRKVLAEQPDTSVTIVSVGFLSNLKNLLQSPPDKISPLDGKSLVAKKVKNWVAMAGWFPHGKETNIKRDSTASKYAIDNWPTPVIFSGFEIGIHIKTGLRVINDGPKNSPVRMVYAISMPKRTEDNKGRMSWDQTAVLAAARGFSPYFSHKTGTFITSTDGSNSWKDDPNGKHKYLLLKMDVDSITSVIENLMMHRPIKQEHSN